MLERFRTSTPVRQVAMVVAALAIISLVLAAIWFFVLRVQYAPIFARLRPADAAAIVGELDKRKIPYRLAQGGTTIAVPADQADAVRLSLAGSEAVLKGAIGFELFDKSDMGITDFAQKINYQRALQGELERTIASLDGVESARVHLSMGDDRLFRQDRAPPKASVTLRMRDAGPVPPATVIGVQQLVSAAVPLLDASAVVVVDEAGRVMGAAGHAGAAGVGLPPRMAEKRAIEQYFEARARAALERVFGPDYIAVAVAAAIPAAETDPALDPARRAFPLQISLRPRNELAGKAREGARAIVARALGLDSVLGDTVVFETPQPFAAGSLPPTGPARRTIAAAAPADEGANLTIYLAAGALGLVLLASAAVLALLGRPRARPLDEDARSTFADRLRQLMDEEVAHDPAQA
jgi:flagellar M-ring protein FliF